MSDSNTRQNNEVLRIQACRDKVLELPDDVVLALLNVRSLSSARVDHVKSQIAQGATLENIIEGEKAYFDKLGEQYDFDLNSVGWLQISPFMAEFTRWIRKRCDESAERRGVHTAAACYNPKTEEVEILYNPRWIASIADKQSAPGIIDPFGAGVNEHEHFHLMLGHVTSRRREPHSLWNIAADLAIDSIVARCDTMSRISDVMLMPGVMTKIPPDPTLPKEVQEAHQALSKIIASLPQEQSSEWYFNKLKLESEKQGYSWGKKGMKVPGAAKLGEDGEDEGWVIWESDSHEGWDDIPEEIRDIVEGKIKHAMRKATEKADSSPNGWGNIPNELREEIRAIAFGSVDWRSVLKNWTGMRQAGGRSRSIKRIDRKYPLIHPGVKRARNPKILVAVDQSGSVDDDQQSRIFGALDGCSKKCTFDLVAFDYTVAADSLMTWKRNTRPKLMRVRNGGTNFDAVTEFVNRPENRGRWDGVIIATDGECGRPSASRVKLAWLVTPGHKLMFEPYEGELVIQMSDKDDVVTGKW